MRLTLSVPQAERTADELNLETRPRQVKDWLEALPTGAVLESARTICDALARLNRSRLDDDTRLKLLELYRPAIFNVLPALEDQFAGLPAPLPERNREAVHLARLLGEELAIGYKHVLLDSQNRRFGFGANKQQPLLIQRIVASLGQVLIASYKAYAPVPPRVWSEIHQVYRFAMDENVPDDPVPDLDGQGSITVAYKQALLLSLADPYRLMQGEVTRLLDYLTRFAAQAQLLQAAPVTQPAGLFLIRLEEDRPARPMSQVAAKPDPANCVLLNCLNLVRLLHQQVTKLEAGTRPDVLQLPDEAKEPAYLDLLRRLLKFWGMAPKRHYNRLKHDSMMEMCVGMRAVHYFVNGKKAFLQPAETTEDTLNFMPNAPRPQQQFEASNWKVLNESAGGISLSKMPGTAVQIRVGDVIAIRPDADKPWSIGVVRWLHSEHADHIELGAQMLSPDALPVAVRPTIGAENAAFELALLFPQNAKLKQHAAILAPAGQYRLQRELELKLGNGTTRMVRAQELLQQTAILELFQFA